MEKRIELIVQIIALGVLGIGCLLVLRPFVSALLSAAIVCFSTWPVHHYVEQRTGGRRTLAALTTTLLLVLILVLPVALLALTLADSAREAAEWLRNVFTAGLPLPPDWLHRIPLIGDNLDGSWREFAVDKAKLGEAIKKLLEPAQRGILNAGILLGEGTLQLSLVAFICFFFYRDGIGLMRWFNAALLRVAGALTPGLLQTAGSTIRSVVYGVIGTAIAQGAAASIGFLIAGVPAAALLGFLTFLLSLVPFGAALIWGGAAIWLFYQGATGWALFMAIYGFVVIGGIDHIAKPLLISRGTDLPFALVFLGVLGGVLAFGFVGLFLGPTLLAVGYALLREWTNQTSAG